MRVINRIVHSIVSRCTMIKQSGLVQDEQIIENIFIYKDYYGDSYIAEDFKLYSFRVKI